MKVIMMGVIAFALTACGKEVAEPSIILLDELVGIWRDSTAFNSQANFNIDQFLVEPDCRAVGMRNIIDFEPPPHLSVSGTEVIWCDGEERVLVVMGSLAGEWNEQTRNFSFRLGNTAQGGGFFRQAVYQGGSRMRGQGHIKATAQSQPQIVADWFAQRYVPDISDMRANPGPNTGPADWALRAHQAALAIAGIRLGAVECRWNEMILCEGRR